MYISRENKILIKCRTQVKQEPMQCSIFARIFGIYSHGSVYNTDNSIYLFVYYLDFENRIHTNSNGNIADDFTVNFIVHTIEIRKKALIQPLPHHVRRSVKDFCENAHCILDKFLKPFYLQYKIRIFKCLYNMTIFNLSKLMRRSCFLIEFGRLKKPIQKFHYCFFFTKTFSVHVLDILYKINYVQCSKYFQIRLKKKKKGNTFMLYWFPRKQ